MKHTVNNYTFNPGGLTLTFNRPDFGNNIDLTRLLLITDVTTAQILYQFNGGGVSVSGNVLTFTSLPQGVQSTDTLQILYDLPQPESTRLTFPDTNVLADDLFHDGTCGWQEYSYFPTLTSGIGVMPVTLGTRGYFGQHALRLTTANVNNSGYAGSARAIHRLSHQAQPGVTNKGIMKTEFWFSYGSDGVGTQSAYNVSAATYTTTGGITYVTLTLTTSSATEVGVGTVINTAGIGGLTGVSSQGIVTSVNVGANQVTFANAGAVTGTYTSGGAISALSDTGPPKLIVFYMDNQRNVNSNTQSYRSQGGRALFAAQWVRVSQSGSSQPTWNGQWQVSQGSGFAYGAAGYVSPASVGYLNTGYYSDLGPNQNLGDMQYVSFVFDTVNGLWLGMQANDQFFDLTACPGNGGAPLPSLLSPNDPSYQASDFNAGTNRLIGISNLDSGGVGTTNPTASWLELHRSRISYL